MHRVTIAGVALPVALGLVACGDDAADVATIDEMRVVKISGDQASPVPPATSAQLTATVGADGYTDSALVAHVVDGEGGAASLAGVSAAVVPAGTDVHWHLADGCGHLFAQTTATDDSAYVINRWAPGTTARTCEASAGRLVGDSIVIDETWSLEVLPGEAVDPGFRGGSLEGWQNMPLPGDLIHDAYGNGVAYLVDPHAFAHRRGDGTAEDRRTLVPDSAGCAAVDYVVADTLVYTAIMEVGGDAPDANLDLHHPSPEQWNDEWASRGDCYRRPA